MPNVINLGRRAITHNWHPVVERTHQTVATRITFWFNERRVFRRAEAGCGRMRSTVYFSAAGLGQANSVCLVIFLSVLVVYQQ